MSLLGKSRLLSLRLALVAAVVCGLGVSSAVAGGISYGFARVERDVEYNRTGDTALLMDMYFPGKSEAPVPAVVYIHGGGWYSGDKTGETGKYFIPGLVARGYLVAAINYRLAPCCRFPAQIEDVKAAVRFLRTNAVVYGIDPEHIGVWGDSAGGHLAALLGVTCGREGNADSVQAVADMYGPADLTAYYKNDNSPHIEHVFGVSDCFCETIIQASPLTHVSSDAPPFLIIHGDKDEVVSPGQSQALYDRLASAGVPARLVVVRNAGHLFSPIGGPISPDREEIADLMADFFDEYLK